MRYLLLLLITTNLYAEAFFPVGKQGVDEKAYYKLHDKKETCEASENHACYDIENCPTDICEIVDNEVVDYVSKVNEQSCQSEFDCDAAFESLICASGSAIKNYDSMSIYCAVSIMKIDGKKLQHNDAKKAAYEADLLNKATLENQKISKKKAAKEALKEMDIEGVTTIAKLKAIVKTLIEAQ